jgi:hypothetical protein
MNPFDAPIKQEEDMLPTDANHPNQTGIGVQTFGNNKPKVGELYDGPPDETFKQSDTNIDESINVLKEEPKKFEKKHHNIIDMYWFVNQKLFKKEQLEQGEAGMLALGYNADFANLRVGFHTIDGNSFTKSSMIKAKMKELTNLNLFSETCFNILDCLRTGKDINVSNFERIIGADNKWTPNQTQITGNAQQIIIRTMNPNGDKFSYTLLDWQITAFASALRYMTEGQSWNKYLDVRMQ